MHLLMVPGWTGSGPDHWQSLWERSDPSFRRVEQRDWDNPTIDEWVAAIDAEVGRCNGPTLLIGHSLGCAAIVHWAARGNPGNVIGAMLVAPADVDAVDAIETLRGFAPMPADPLPFTSLVVASEDDDYVSLPRARELADVWRSRFISIGCAGHINTASGHGPWDDGLRLLRELIAGLHPETSVPTNAID